jgi:hypothetical protein
MTRFPATSKRWAVAAFLSCVLSQSVAQRFLSNGKPTELVVIKYEKLVTAGDPLTRDGWKTVSALFDSSQPYPVNGSIFLMSTGGAVGEYWSKKDTAEVETKWTDYFGSIDSNLRYHAPPEPRVTMTTFTFRLQFTNKHRDLDHSGRTIKETTGPWQWKVTGPLKERWTTINKALKYVAQMRDSSSDPVIKKNAEKTIKILEALKSCGKNSAC